MNLGAHDTICVERLTIFDAHGILHGRRNPTPRVDEYGKRSRDYKEVCYETESSKRIFRS